MIYEVLTCMNTTNKNAKLCSFLKSFSTRLRETRIAMKLNQTQFGKIGGVSLSAQACYENGMRYPNIYYLGKLAQNGVDVNYIITGTYGAKND